MNSSLVGRNLGTVFVLALVANVGWNAETPRPAAGKAPAGSTAQRSAATRGGTAKGPLPDPALLDGATQPVEKKSEHGMIGDFELPGDENAKNGKVGGPQDQNPANAGGQGGTPPGQPPGGGGGGPQAPQQEGAQPQQGGAQQAGGAQTGGPQGGGAGAGDPGAQPQGVQVAELGGAPSAQQAGAGAPGGKPQAVGIGDKAMRIDQAGGNPGVVGGQQQQVAPHTQQHDKGTGSGGKGSAPGTGPGRVEKGRVIPAGL